MLINLRGVRESGIAFSVPTYVFIAIMLLLIAMGVSKALLGPARTPAVQAPAPAPMAGIALTFLILRGFAEGCVAMTGTEAISNGVGAFKAPGSKNAAITLSWMAAILAAFFIGDRK